MTGPPVQARIRFALGENLTVLSASAGVNALLGYSAEDFLGSRVAFRDLIHPGDGDIAEMLFYPECPNRSGSFNFRLRHADGRIRCVCGQYTRKSADDKQTKSVDLWLQDAKSQFESQGAPESLTTIAPTMDIVNDAVYFKNRNHVFTAANSLTRKAFENLCGNVVGLTDYDIFPEEYADAYYKLETETLAGSPVARETQAVLGRDGERRWVDNRKYPVRDPNGEIIGLFGVGRDVTQDKMFDERLRESEESLKESQRIAGLGSYITDLRRREWTSSEVLDQLFGIGKEYVRNIDGWVALVHPDEQEQMIGYFVKEVIGERRPFDREFRIIRQTDKAVRWVYGRGRLEFNAQGQPHKIHGTIQDITERKLADAALRESEESLKESQRIAGLGSYVVDIGTGVWTSSEVLDQLFGIGKDYVRSVDGWEALVHPGDRGKMAAYFADEVLGQGNAFNQEYRIVCPSDGVVRWVHGLGRLEFDAQGRPVKMHGTIQDITERKLADAALRESEESLKESQRIAGLGSYIGDLASGDWTSSDMLDEMFGIDKNYVRTIEGWAALVHPDDRAMMMSYFADDVLGKDKAFDKEYRIVRHSDGAVRWVHDLGRLERDAQGRPVKMHGTVKDITERKQSEIDLRESKELLQLFIEHAPAALAMLDREMRYLAVSHRWLESHSLVGRDVIGHSHYEVFPNLNESWKEEHRRALAGEVLLVDEKLLERTDGSARWLKRKIQPWKTGDGEVGGVLLFSEDITKQRENEERLRMAASVFTNAREGIVITDDHGAILDVNDMFTRITGYGREEVLGKNPRILKSGLHGEEFYANMWRSLVQEGQWSGELWNRNKNGDVYAEMKTITSVRDASGKLVRYVALFSDITQMKKHAQQLEHVTHYDLLTNLPNRALLADRLQQAMAQAKRRNQNVAVAYLDLDGFKGVNDQHGREVGDRLLTSLAFNMKCALREGDTLARIGGDEFAAVMLDLDDTESCASILDQLKEAAAEQVQIGDQSLRVSASIGVTYYPQPGEVDADMLLRQADQAMYQAKLAGGNRHHTFDPDQDDTVRGRHENLERIRQALAAHEFVLFYQPKVNMRTGEVVGAEALIRWQHPERGLLPPGMFLPVIEDQPLAIELGEWVIESALAQMDRWREAGLEMPVSVNVGALQLLQADFVDRLSCLLAAHPGVKPFSLEIEVLETSALQDVVKAAQVLNACHAMGVALALDDFGTGYSSLTYLKRLPASILKIDRSFVCDMLDDPENLNILEGILGLASAFHRQVIAEGVETVEHGLMLLQLGCELAQGYGIARPMPASELPNWVSVWKPDPRWAQVPLVHSGNRGLLYAGVAHRAWFAAFEAFAHGRRHAPPMMNPRECRFGMWLESERQAGRGTSPGFIKVDEIHQAFHELAGEILTAQLQGRNTEGLGRLASLQGMCANLEEHLDSYGQV